MVERKRMGDAHKSDEPSTATSNESGAAKNKEQSASTGAQRAAEGGKFTSSVGKTHGRIAANLEELEKTRAEVENLKNQLRLVVADSKNLERLLQKEVSDARVFSISGFARDLVISCDNLEASLKNLNAEDSVHAGIKMTWDSLVSTLEKHGVERLNPAGEVFDARFHTAVTQAVNNDSPAGTILEVIQVGYTLHGKVLRPASVIVSKKSD